MLDSLPIEYGRDYFDAVRPHLTDGLSNGAVVMSRVASCVCIKSSLQVHSLYNYYYYNT